MFDKNEREINYLRLSITDKCNLKCKYCVSEKGSEFCNDTDMLTISEIEKIVTAFSLIGIKKIRITGGEPLVRKDFEDILEKISNINSIEELVMTTNGINLFKKLDILKNKNIKKINISLDSLDAEKYKEITRGGDFNNVFKGINEALEKNIEIQLNTVIMKGINDNEILDFVNLTKNLNINVRFIELMPIGEGKKFTSFRNNEILELIEKKYVLENKKRESLAGPGVYYKVLGYSGNIGFISPISHGFCESCNRIRVSSKGFLKLCLHYKDGIDLRPYLNDKITVEKFSNILENIIFQKKPKEHKMTALNEVENIETKSMNEIGG